MVFNYTCCGQHFTHHQAVLDHVEQVHHVPIKWSFAASGAPSPSDTSISTSLSAYSTTAGSGSGIRSNHGVSTTTGPPKNPLSQPFRCPKPNCTKSYRQAGGLKYHIAHGTCTFASSTDVQLVKDLSEKRKEMQGMVDVGAAALLPTTSTSEAERRLRPFACGVGDCPKRYKNIYGLKYHYQHSGEHGAVGLALLASGDHGFLGWGESEQDGQQWGGHDHGQSRSSVSSVSGRVDPFSGFPPHYGEASNIFERDVENVNGGPGSSEEENDPSISKKHVCPTCSKGFNRASALRIHINSHIVTTPFRCQWPNCSREFNVESNMHGHYRKHTITRLRSRPRQQQSASASTVVPGTNDNGGHGGETDAVAGGNEGRMAWSSPQSQQHRYRKDSVPAMLSSISTSSNSSGESLSGSQPYSLFSQTHSTRKSPIVSGAVTSARWSHSPNLVSRSPVDEDYLVIDLSAYARRPLNSSSVPENVSKTFPSLGKRRLACENCRRRKMKCDPSLVECLQCQRSGLQCTFGDVERGRSRYRTRRTQSVPNPQKVNVALSSSQLTSFPPPPPFPPGLPNVKTQKRCTEQQPRPRVQCEANNNYVLKTNQGQRKIGNQHIIPESPSLVSVGDSRPRSLSFHRPTERDPKFGRPYSHPSSRPPSRPSSVHGSPISNPGLWFKSPASFQEACMKEHVSSTPPPAVVKSSSRLAIPLPVPPVAMPRLQRATRERDWGKTRTDHLGSYTVPGTTPSPRRTQHRRFSRPPSPHPYRPSSSRSSFSLPLERKSSFSRSSPGPVSGTSSRPSSRPSSRSSFSSPVQYSPNPSPKEAFKSYMPPFAPTFVFPPEPPSRPTQLLSSLAKRIRRGFWNRRGDFLTPDGYIVYAPPYLAYPNELQSYPPEGEGYQNHEGLVMSFTPRPELPASLPRHGKPAERPYDSFVVYQYL